VSALRVELAALALDRGEQPAADVAIALDFACGGGAHATVTLEGEAHAIDLSDLAPEIRPRVLAIAVAEQWPEREAFTSQSLSTIATSSDESETATATSAESLTAPEPPPRARTMDRASLLASPRLARTPTAPSFALRASFVATDLPETPVFVSGASLELRGAFAGVPLGLYLRAQGLFPSTTHVFGNTEGYALEGVVGGFLFADVGPLRIEGALGIGVGYAHLATTANAMMGHRDPPPYEVGTVALDAALALRLTLVGPLGVVLGGGVHPYLRGVDGPDARHVALRDAMPWVSLGFELAF